MTVRQIFPLSSVAGTKTFGYDHVSFKEFTPYLVLEEALFEVPGGIHDFEFRPQAHHH